MSTTAVDWTLAAKLARRVAAEPAARELPGDLAARCVRAQERVIAYTGLEPFAPSPEPEAVDRGGWIDANLVSFRSTLEPVVERTTSKLGKASAPVTIAASAVISAEVGGLTGYMSRRVLGQYEVALLDSAASARLLFVTPNLLDAATALGTDADTLLDWVAFHECTHVVQFTSVPWLRDHLAGLLRTLLASLDVSFDWRGAARLPRRDDLRDIRDALRHSGMLGAVVGPRRRALIDSVQGTMAMVEGHAEHVMDAVGVDVLPDLPQLRQAMARRRRDRPPLMKLLERVLGFELKMSQYEVGKSFCDAVVKQRGIARLNDAWASPAMLPSAAELREPRAWLARTEAAAA